MSDPRKTAEAILGTQPDGDLYDSCSLVEIQELAVAYLHLVKQPVLSLPTVEEAVRIRKMGEAAHE